MTRRVRQRDDSGKAERMKRGESAKDEGRERRREWERGGKRESARRMQKKRAAMARQRDEVVRVVGRIEVERERERRAWRNKVKTEAVKVRERERERGRERPTSEKPRAAALTSPGPGRRSAYGYRRRRGGDMVRRRQERGRTKDGATRSVCVETAYVCHSPRCCWLGGEKTSCAACVCICVCVCVCVCACGCVATVENSAAETGRA